MPRYRAYHPTRKASDVVLNEIVGRAEGRLQGPRRRRRQPGSRETLDMQRGDGGTEGTEGHVDLPTDLTQTLAQVAVRTASAVVITDPSGQIEWVNQAFV